MALKEAIAASDAVLFVTPEYNRSIPGALKNAIDWASRPWGQNSFDHMPAAVIGASPGQIGTALAQQSLRAVLSFCNARQMTAPEAYIRFRPEVFTDDGEVTDESTAAFLADFMQEFRDPHRTSADRPPPSLTLVTSRQRRPDEDSTADDDAVIDAVLAATVPRTESGDPGAGALRP